jgi:hypothetical protein
VAADLEIRQDAGQARPYLWVGLGHQNRRRKCLTMG